MGSREPGDPLLDTPLTFDINLAWSGTCWVFLSFFWQLFNFNFPYNMFKITKLKDVLISTYFNS